MTEETKSRHIITVESRSKAKITGVADVLSFDEDCIIADTADGAMTLKGHELHVISLDLEKGLLTLDGEITELSYAHTPIKNGVFGKIFK